MNTKTETSLTQDIEQGNQAGHVVAVSPEMAEQWLTLNTKNRHARPQRVGLYASDMADGHWQMTGEAIKFSKAGALLDGQHRLAAVIRAGVSVQMMIVTGLDDSTQTVMDSGAKRTGADSLKLQNVTHGAAVAAAARIGIAYESGWLTRAAAGTLPPVSNSQVMTWLDFNSEVTDIVPRINATKAGLRYPGKSRAAGIFAWNEMRKIDAAEADLFFKNLLEAIGTGAGDPMSALQRKFAQRQQWRAPTEAHLIFRTWNAVRAGERLRQIKSPHASTPFADPR